METSTQLMTVSLRECQDPCKVSMTGVNGVLSQQHLFLLFSKQFGSCFELFDFATISL
jgi:hypothetical protein